MTQFFLLTIFLLHYGQVYAGWLAVEKQYKPIGLETLYFDPKTIHRNGIRVTLWQLTDLKWNNTTRFLSTKAHKEFDREHPRVRVLQVMEFSRQMGTGRSKPGYIETGSWQSVEEPLSTTRSGKQLAGSPTRPPRPLAAPSPARTHLDVVIEEKLVRMRTQTHRIDLLASLVADPGLDQILGKHLSLEQELVVLL